MAVTLDSLARRVDALPLNSAEAVAPVAAAPEAPADSADWRALARSVWSELKALVVVRRMDRPSSPMLPPDQEYFLRQNLRLQIESARLAMLRQDVTGFEAALSTAYDWLNAHFDVTDSRVDGMVTEIQVLSGMQIKPQLPDISGALKLLRSRLRSRDGGSAPPAAPPADEAG
jgi:uroporphyrin-3 C-methyltransferase